jgi:hypothetical protein
MPISLEAMLMKKGLHEQVLSDQNNGLKISQEFSFEERRDELPYWLKTEPEDELHHWIDDIKSNEEGKKMIKDMNKKKRW